MIISGGYNVYPAELEAVLARHPDVAEVAVVGVPDARWGEAVKAIVVARRDIGEAEVLEHCNRLLAGYKRPKSVDFVDALPKGSTGKILRRELRDRYWEGMARRCLIPSPSSAPPAPRSVASAGRSRDLSIPTLGAVAAAAAMSHAGIDPADVDEFAMGVNLPGADRSIARQTALHAGVPDTCTAYTVDRACCSSLTALTLARRAVLSGEAKIALAGGGENLSRVPYFLEGIRFGRRIGDIVLDDQLRSGAPTPAWRGPCRRRTRRSATASIARLRTSGPCAATNAPPRPSGPGCSTTRSRPSWSMPGPHVDRDESIRPDTTLARLAELATVNGSSDRHRRQRPRAEHRRVVRRRRPRRCRPRRSTSGRRGAVGRTGRRAPGEDRLDPRPRRPRRRSRVRRWSSTTST